MFNSQLNEKEKLKIIPDMSMHGLTEDQDTQFTGFLCRLKIFTGEDCR